MSEPDYQLIIVGAGPAGLTAGLYAARARLNAVLVEKGAVGGQVLSTDWIDNYPGFDEGVSGFDLIEKMTQHADRFGLKTRIAPVTSMDLDDSVKTLHLENGETMTAKAIILSTGGRPRQLGIPGENEFAGKGVSYCGTCDAPFYRNQEIAVAGGGNTAIQEALHLTKFADKVTIIHRREELRATKILQEKAFSNDKIDFIWNANVQSIEGENGVDQLKISHNNGETSILAVTGIFIFIGAIPNNEMLPLDQLKTDKAGFVITDSEMQTNIPGVMAAGDIRSKNYRQIVNAAGEGAVAELSVEHFLGAIV